MIPAFLNASNVSSQPSSGLRCSVNPTDLNRSALNCLSNLSHHPIASSCLLPIPTPHVRALGFPFSAKRWRCFSIYSPGLRSSDSAIGPTPLSPNHAAIPGHISLALIGWSLSSMLMTFSPHASGFSAAWIEILPRIFPETGVYSDRYPASSPGNGTSTVFPSQFL